MEPTSVKNGMIILVGGTGKLGQRIAWHLRKQGATVRALVRPGSAGPALSSLQGAAVVEVDFQNVEKLQEACAGGTCLVSALSGVHDVIVELQKKLLAAAVAAGIPRFIPSDYCIDFTKLPAGTNRNLDLRREFAQYLDSAPIRATSILNGMFTDLLMGPAPVILFGLKRIVYWGDADQPLDFTTMEDTAAFTALAAMDPGTPRYLRIAGDVASINRLKKETEEATGKKFRLLRAGGLKGLARMIRITRALFPKKEEVFPPWQGMQYLHNMFTGLPKLDPLDNSRYPLLQWQTVAGLIRATQNRKNQEAL